MATVAEYDEQFSELVDDAWSHVLAPGIVYLKSKYQPWRDTSTHMLCTNQRVANRLSKRGHPVRVASRLFGNVISERGTEPPLHDAQEALSRAV